eukprot:m.12288 g.12288  ORF g.12288 m.12288 type:complete len:62 (+) comp4529_c0_seq1:977-1162(+)
MKVSYIPTQTLYSREYLPLGKLSPLITVWLGSETVRPDWLGLAAIASTPTSEYTLKNSIKG